MNLKETIRRAEKELATATRNLDMANRRGAPEQDVLNLEAKVEYRKAVLETLKSGHLELFGKVEQLKKENADLLKRAEQMEREREEAVRLCGELIALCSPPKDLKKELSLWTLNLPEDYNEMLYDFLGRYIRIINNFSEAADDELYTDIQKSIRKAQMNR